MLELSSHTFSSARGALHSNRLESNSQCVQDTSKNIQPPGSPTFCSHHLNWLHLIKKNLPCLNVSFFRSEHILQRRGIIESNILVTCYAGCFRSEFYMKLGSHEQLINHTDWILVSRQICADQFSGHCSDYHSGPTVKSYLSYLGLFALEYEEYEVHGHTWADNYCSIRIKK